jgi:hypothetical protein
MRTAEQPKQTSRFDLPPLPEVGECYRRKFGDRQIVEVKALSPDGFIKIKDNDGMHFVRAGTFHEFFEKV